MKRVLFYVFFAAVLAFVMSCASAPPAQPAPEPTPEQPVVEQPPVEQPPAVPDPTAERDQARSLKQKVDTYGLGTYDPETYQSAGSSLKAGEESYGKDNTASKASFMAAIDGYNAVLAKGTPLYLADAQVKTEASLAAADDAKAPIAVPDQYTKAYQVYLRALSEKTAGDLESAGKDFTDAEAQFESAVMAAQQKKEAAMQLLQDAEQSDAASQQKAAEAAETLSGEGFAPSGS